MYLLAKCQHNANNNIILGLAICTFYASAAYAAPEALCVSFTVPSSVRLVTNTFVSLRNNTKRISVKFAEVITTTNRLNDYISKEITTETRKQDTRQNRIDINRFAAMLNSC